MALRINHSLVTPEVAERLAALCPFGAFEYREGRLSAGAGCRLCRLCVLKGPTGVVTWEEDAAAALDRDAWRGVAVFAELRDGAPHPVALELLGKARELATAIGQPACALVIGSGAELAARELLHYGADAVYLYDDEAFREYAVSPYTAAFADFVRRVRPCAVLVGATSLGRSLAPAVAARCGAGLTADCTMLQMRENTDLVQIRPAFGGNIMAQIVTPHTRPQFCTVRYRVFDAPPREPSPRGSLLRMQTDPAWRVSGTQVLCVERKPRQTELSEADVIIAVGRGLRSRGDLALIEDLAARLNAVVAGTRPVIEAGWLDPRRQIGLSGRTVKPRLIITAGISGAVQFTSCMRNAGLIVAINTDERAPIFDVAHIGLVGDLYEVLPGLIQDIRENGHV